MPAWLAQHIVELEALAVDFPEASSAIVEQLLGRPARTIDEFLYEYRHEFESFYSSNKGFAILRSLAS